MRLRAVEPALAPHAARADGNHGLQNVVARAQRVFGWVQQGEHALFLVVVHTVIPHHGQRGGKGDDGGKQGFPRQPRKENHKQARSHNQRGGAQIGLLQNQGDGHGNNRQRGKIMEPRKVVFIALEKPRHRHRQPDFHDFGRLQAHKAETQPAR